MWMRTALQQLLTEGQKLLPAPIREEAGKSNPDEPARQDMEQEAAQELFGGNRHLALLAAVSVILPSEGDLAVGNGDETVIGDGDTMGIAGQVMQHMLRPSEGAFRIDHPILAKEWPEESMKGFLSGQCLEATGKHELALTKGALQASDKLAAKDTAEHFHRQEKGIAGMDPALVVWRQTTRGDHAVNVGMMASALTIP